MPLLQGNATMVIVWVKGEIPTRVRSWPVSLSRETVRARGRWPSGGRARSSSAHPSHALPKTPRCSRANA